LGNIGNLKKILGCDLKRSFLLVRLGGPRMANFLQKIEETLKFP